MTPPTPRPFWPRRGYSAEAERALIAAAICCGAMGTALGFVNSISQGSFDLTRTLRHVAVGLAAAGDLFVAFVGVLHAKWWYDDSKASTRAVNAPPPDRP